MQKQLIFVILWKRAPIKAKHILLVCAVGNLEIIPLEVGSDSDLRRFHPVQSMLIAHANTTLLILGVGISGLRRSVSD